MRVPHTVPKNVTEAYKCSGQTLLLPREQARSIRAENSTWDDSVIPELRTLALRALAERWKDNPILEELPSCVDRDALLEILPIDLPFDLIVTRIRHEYYWSRIARHRWEYNNPEDHGNSWRRLYCERHLAEYLERLEPEYFESQPEECEHLVKLVEPYVHTLRIRSLMSSKFPVKLSAEGEGAQEEQKGANTEEIENQWSDTKNVHHIPFAVILPRLSEIRELALNFGMIYTKDGFEWRDFRFSIEDCLGLGRAIKNCPRMVKVSLTRSDFDQPRVAAALQGMVLNHNITEIDFSHCALGDSGAHAMGEFLKNHKGLRVLSLMNNLIGAEGLAGMVHGLLQETATPLKRLNLRLNPLRDDGGVHVCALLLRIATLEWLNISGCGLGPETSVALAEVLSSGYPKFSTMSIDLSNNDLGPIAGEALDAAMKTCSTIVALDVRMCNVLKESESSINDSITRNLEEKRKERRAIAEAHKRSTRSGKSKKPAQRLEAEGSQRSVQIQEDPTASSTGQTKSILKIGAKRSGVEASQSTMKSGLSNISTTSSR